MSEMKTLNGYEVVDAKARDEISQITDNLPTLEEKAIWNAKSDFSGNYNDLSNKPIIPTIISSVTNGSTKAVTSGAVYTALASKADAAAVATALEAKADKSDVLSWPGAIDMDGRLFTTGLWYLYMWRKDNRFAQRVTEPLGIVNITVGSTDFYSIYSKGKDRELIIYGNDGSWEPVKPGTTEVDSGGGFYLYAVKLM